MTDQPPVMALVGSVTPSALLNTPGQGVPERTTVAHLVYDPAPRWPGPRIVVTNGSALMVAAVQHQGGVRVPPGTIGRKALKLIERVRRFTGTDKRVEPMEAANEERLVVMRPEVPVLDPTTVWPEEPDEQNVLAVTLDVNQLALLAQAMGSSNVTLKLDMVSRVDGEYQAPIFVQLPGGGAAEGVLMPIMRSK